MIRPITGTILILAILTVIPFQAQAVTPTETVETGLNHRHQLLED